MEIKPIAMPGIHDRVLSESVIGLVRNTQLGQEMVEGRDVLIPNAPGAMSHDHRPVDNIAERAQAARNEGDNGKGSAG